LDQTRGEFGLIDDERISRLANSILKGDIAAGITAINELSSEGLDLRQLNRSLVEYLRNLLLVKNGVNAVGDVTQESAAAMKKMVSRKSLQELTTAIKIFAQADFRADPQSTLSLELALVDYCMYIDEANAKHTEKVSAGQRDENEVSRTKPTISRTEKSTIPTDSFEPASNTIEESTVQKTTITESHFEKETYSIPPPPHDIDQIRKFWPDFIKACRGMGSSGNLDALLRSSCEVAGIEEETITLDFRHEWHKNKVEDPKYRHQIEVKLKDVFGVPYRIQCRLSTRPKEISSQLNKKQSNPVVDAALKMGARIIEEEQINDE